MQFSSQLILSGEEIQINLKPTITYTSDYAISLLHPRERNCYTNSEKNLTFNKLSSGFRYSLDNCIIDNLIGNVIWHCKCIPNIASVETKIRFLKMSIRFCSGEELKCANLEFDSVYNVTSPGNSNGKVSI